LRNDNVFELKKPEYFIDNPGCAPNIISFYFSDIRYCPIMPRNARIDAPGVLYYIIVRHRAKKNISVRKAAGKSQSKNFFLLLGG
jgi:hypothetical protein